MLMRAPFASLARYLWHVIAMLEGRGKVAEFRQAGYTAAMLPFLVLRAHVSALVQPAAPAARTAPDPRRARASRRASSARCSPNIPSPSGRWRHCEAADSDSGL